MGTQQAMAAAAMVRPVYGFATQFPLAAAPPASSSQALKGRALFSSSFSRHHRRPLSSFHHGKAQRRTPLSVSAHFGDLPGPETVQAHAEMAQHFLRSLDAPLSMLADAAATADSALEVTETVKQGSDGWLGGLTDALEKILIFLKDGLATLNVPYAYGFAIILLTLLVKAATFPLTKSQVESTIAMQNLQPKLKAIQARYQGDQERIQLETARLYKQAGVNPLAGCLPTLATLPIWIGLYRALSNVANEGLLTEGFFWIPSLAGPTTIAARAGGNGSAWLFPFEDGVPPLGWPITVSYLILPVLLVVSQFVSMQIMQPPQSTDPSQKNTQLILKFLPLMIGYFSLSVPSGLSLYWLTNNILSTAQQVWLRKGTAAAADINSSIISAGQAKRSGPPSVTAASSSSAPKELRSFKEDRRGERFKELKEKEAQRKAQRDSVKAQAGGDAAPLENSNGGSPRVQEEEEDILDDGNESSEKLEVQTSGSGGPSVSSGPKRSKRSKRTRAE